MRPMQDENAKRRLTERAQIAVAVDFLMGHGIRLDDIPVHLCRRYYVDIDLLNEILAADQMLTAPLPAALPVAAPAMLQVA